ncbi:MAG: TolC family protein, partial [Bacteroidales bacterium]|nr:TolC family protein [Bacteroidales bacterium]
MRRKYILGMLFCLLMNSAAQIYAQDPLKVSLSLRNVVDLAISQSSAVKYVQNQDVNYYWRWKNHQTRFRPQLTLSGNLPDFENQTKPITQPDGSIEFNQVTQLETSAQLAITQPIPQLGAYVYAASGLVRLQDFNNGTVGFSGVPVSVGITQPLFAYNWMKWSRMTEPLVYEEAQKRFIESIEEISYNATARFFNYLKIQTDYSLAESNLSNSQDNLKIAEVKKELGNISGNDFSRIQLSVFNAQKALNNARISLKNADYELKKYIGLDQDKVIILIIPLDMFLWEVDPDLALAESMENRRETPQFERRLIQADRDLTRAKREAGVGATLRMSYGVSNSADNFGGIYENPEQQQNVALALSVPIMDWGRSESRVKLAESQRELVLYDVDQDKQDFERGVVVQVEQFNLIRSQIATAEAADKVAEEGYIIALKRFQNGEISITDLNISLQEREGAKRDYIRSIENYWESFYRLREVTLYDFEFKQKIYYTNPML